MIRKYYGLLCICIALYLLFFLLTPPDPAIIAKFGLSSAALRFVSLTVYIPYIIIWIIAFYGFIKFKEYTQLIPATADGQPMSEIAQGHMLLAFSLPASGLCSALINLLERHDAGMLPPAVIAKNYITLGITLAGFALIARGAASLLKITKTKSGSSLHPFWLIMLGVIGTAYLLLVLLNPVRQFSSDSTVRAAYYLPDLIIITTIIIPYVYVWYLGFKSSQDILAYHTKSKGLLYRSFLRSLASGVVWVAISTIMLQFFVAMNNVLAPLSLKPLLLIIYVLLACIGYGYVKIARGAYKLKKIEEA